MVRLSFKSSRIRTINRRTCLTTLHCSHNHVGRKRTHTLVAKSRAYSSRNVCMYVSKHPINFPFQVGDLLMVPLNMIPTAVSMLRGTLTWFDGPFGVGSCKLLIFSQGLSIACSIFSLTVLAVERFFVVVFPLWNIITIKGTLLSILVIWVAAFAFSSPLLYASKVRLYDGVAFCIEDWSPALNAKRAHAIYTIVAFVFLYALPLLIIAVLYSIIAAKVWSRRTPGNMTQANRRVSQESKKNVLKMSVAVVLAFAFCWFLMHLNMLLIDFSDVFEVCDIPKWLQITGFLLSHANSAINCFIYPIFSQEYRRGFKQSLKSLCWKHARCTPQNDREPRAAGIPLEGQMAN